MVSLPFVVHATYHRAFQISLTFNDGTEATVDFEGWLKGPVFEPVRDEDFFRRFFIDAGAISWPNGADIAPETLYERARGSFPMTGQDPIEGIIGQGDGDDVPDIDATLYRQV